MSEAGNNKTDNPDNTSIYTNNNVSSNEEEEEESRIRQNKDEDEIVSTIGAPQYSINLSHASKDPMIAGPNELFNRNVETFFSLS